MKSSFIMLVFPLLLTLSCNNNKVKIITYNLKRSDFVEKINVAGTVQAVNNFPVAAPRNNYGTMTVTHLVDDGSYIKKGDTICILSSPNLFTSYESFVTELENIEADLKKLEADNELNLSLLKAQLENTEAQMKISSLDSVQMKFAPPVKQKLLALEMEKYIIEKRKLERKFISQKIIDASEIRQMKSRILQQQMRIQTMEDQINSLTIIASRDGFVMHTESPTIMIMSTTGAGTLGGKIEEGSNVFSNMALLQLPDLSKMQVSSEVAEADYKRIEKGQKVSVSIDAIKNLLTSGIINRKMLIGKTRQSDSKVKTYEVIINIDSCHLKMKPGLSASCEITVEEVKDTIIVPTLAIFESDTLKIVYVSEDNKFIPVTIETGESNSSHTIVAKGLKGNETIALSEPPHNLIKHPGKSIPEKSPAERIKTELIEKGANLK
jgi:HlyD family secretion protein